MIFLKKSCEPLLVYQTFLKHPKLSMQQIIFWALRLELTWASSVCCSLIYEVFFSSICNKLLQITITRPPPRKNDQSQIESSKITSARRESTMSPLNRRESTMSVLNSKSLLKQKSVSSVKEELPLFYIFNCKCWLSHDEGDQQVVREFAPSKLDGKPLYPDSSE